MKKSVLITTRLLPEGLSSFSENYQLIMPEKEAYTHEELCEKLPFCNALIAAFSFPIGEKEMRLAPQMKVIATYGVGYNHIDLQAAKKYGIAVFNTPDAVTEPTAEMAMALLFSVARRVAECDRKLRTNSLHFGMLKNLGVSLLEKTLAVVGMGRIGKSITRRAQAMGMNVVYYSRTRLSLEEERLLNVRFLPFEEALKVADVVSLSVPLTEQTHHLINKTTLQLMKSSAILINTSRGAVVDEAALAEVLEQKAILGAGLDVYENEPNIHPLLLTLDNVVLAPHSGTATVDARNAISKQCVENIMAFFEDKDYLQNRVV